MVPPRQTTTIMHHADQTHTTGFTLVELLVVVAIFSLLISMLLPSLGRAHSFAKMAVCVSRIRTIGMATHFYLNEYADHYPNGVRYADTQPPFVPYCFDDTLNTYLGLGTTHYRATLDAARWHCPVIQQLGGPGFTSPGVFTPNPNLMANLLDDMYWTESAGNMLWTGRGDTPRHVKESEVRESPSRNAAWMDSCDVTFTWEVDNNIKGGFGSQHQQTTPHFGQNLNYDRNNDSLIVLNDNVASNGLGTAVFRDGHAEARKAIDWVGSDSVGATAFSNNPSYTTR